MDEDVAIRTYRLVVRGYRGLNKPSRCNIKDLWVKNQLLSIVLKCATNVAKLRTDIPLSPSPVEILFGSYRRRILALLFVRPDEQFHVREISRLTGIPAGSLHRELKLLATGELLTRSRSGSQVYYQANRDCQVFPELASLFRKSENPARRAADAT